tara:strand:+ start:151 stop:477 length:327 start_codon:yes stop_codon:yes gene_type:complete
MDELFTLYEADDKHLAIAWGPMTWPKVLAQAIELILESDDHLGEPASTVSKLKLEWVSYRARNLEKGDSIDCATTAMMLLCEWLNERRGAYSHYFTEEISNTWLEGVE